MASLPARTVIIDGRAAHLIYEDGDQGLILRVTSGLLHAVNPRAVEIREGLVRPKIEKETAEAIAENPIAPVKVKASYSAPLCRYIAYHKTVAVAEILLASPRTAQEVLIVRTLNGLRLHEAFAAFGKEAETQSAYRVLEKQAVS